jgi:hypothetical protein
MESLPMSGLVLELQRDALDKNVDVSSLLRKAVVVSKKLGITEIETWIKQELAGYPADDDAVPTYREVSGVIKVFNPFQGWQPVNFEDAELGETLSRRKISQAIGELVAIAENDKSRNLQVPFSQHIKNDLMKMMDSPLEPTLLVSDAQIHGILEAVRNEILNWALDLEAKGIIGDDMSFSSKEKAVASQVTYQVINNIGSMQNSQLQQDSAGASQTQNITKSEVDISAFIEELKACIHDLGLDKDDTAELEAEVLTIEHQLASPKPKNIIIIESLKSTRSIIEGITGSVLATGFLAQLAALI